MADQGNKSEDFDSTIPINLAKLDPYQDVEDAHEKTTILDRSLDHDFQDLDAELSALDEELNAVDSGLDDVLEFGSKLDDEEASSSNETSSEEVSPSASESSLEFETIFDPEEDGEAEDLFAFDASDIDLEEVGVDEQSEPSVLEEAPIEPEHVDFDEALEHEIAELVDHVEQASDAEDVAGAEKSVEADLKLSPETAEDENNEYDISPQLEEKEQAVSPVFTGLSDTHAKEIVSHENASAEQSSSQGNGKNTKVAIFAACVGLVAGAAGLWSASSASGQVDALQQELLSMEAQLKVYKQKLTTLEKAKQEAVTVQKASPVQSVNPKAKPELKAVAKVESKPIAAVTVEKVVTPNTPVKKAGAATPVSGWVVNVSSDRSQKLAQGMSDKLQKSGVQSIVTPTNIKGVMWYRVQVTGFDTKESAKASAKTFLQEQGIEGVWVGKAQ